MTSIALWPRKNYGFSKRKMRLCNGFFHCCNISGQPNCNVISMLQNCFYHRWNEMKSLMTSQMGNASVRCALGCPRLWETDTLLLFCPALQSELVNSISRSGWADLSRLCSETWCYFAVGHILVKCPSLFKDQMRNLGIWIVLTLPAWWAVCRVGCVLKKTSRSLRLASPRLV